MPIYHVSYDLRRGEHEYKGLWEALEALGGRRALESSWLVPFPRRAYSLYEHIASHLGRDDRIVITEIASDNDKKFLLVADGLLKWLDEKLAPVGRL